MFAIYSGKNLSEFGSLNKERMPNDEHWIFRSASLAFVLECVEAQYGIKFDASSANINQTFSGLIPREDLQIALSILLRPLRIEYQINQNTYVLSNASVR